MFKFLLLKIFVILFVSCSIINSETHVAMYGNPGGGKSTLLSCLTNTPGNFPSGLNMVTGLTKEFTEKKYGDMVYIDTPGLADTHDREKAALEIEQSLKKNENYKLIFVVKITSGRMDTGDLATMNLIIESVLPENIKFGIIYNKLSKRTYQEYKENPDLLNSLHKSHLKREPHSYLLLEKLDELEDQDNTITNNEKFMTDLRNFVAQLPVTYIPKEKVDTLPTNEYENQLKTIEDNYKREQEERQREIARLQEEYNNSCIRYETERDDRSTPFDRKISSKKKWYRRKRVTESIHEIGEKIDTYIRTNCVKGSGAIQYGEWIYASSHELVTGTDTRRS